MARPDETGASYISKLNVNNATYTIKDAWSRAAIKEIETAIAGGVHFRGISTTAIADGMTVKDLEVKDGESTKTVTAASQVDGDMFIYNAGTAEKPKNLEFIVAGGKYSELGSTGVLKALAFKDEAAGSVTIPLQTNITAEAYTPQVSKGTLAVTFTEGSLSTSSEETAANITYTTEMVTVGTETGNAGLSETATAASVTTEATAASVTTEATAASVTHTATAVTTAGPSVSLTYTTGTFTALQDVTYDGTTATLSISSVTSDAFTKVPSVDTVGNITVTYDKTSGVTYAKVTAVTYDKIAAVTYDKTTGVTYDKATTITYAKTSAVTYDKVSASGTFLTAASLEGDLSVTAAAPTLTITNPTVTVTVS